MTEDLKGSEQVLLHAEKDLTTKVEHDASYWVGHDETTTVDHNHAEHVKGGETITIDTIAQRQSTRTRRSGSA